MTVDVRIEVLSRTAVAEDAPRAVLIVPTAAIEQHGPHLPVGTDALIIEHLARRAAERARDGGHVCFVAPVVSYGSSHHHLPFPGTLSLRAHHFLDAIKDIGESASRWGVRRLLFLNGHGGNDSLVQQAARDLAIETDLVVAAGSYWTLASNALNDLRPPGWPSIPGHSGAFETSVMLALHPDLVDKGRLPRREWPSPAGATEAPTAHALIQRPGWMASLEGFTDSPAVASEELGRRYLDAVIAEIATFLCSFAPGEDNAAGTSAHAAS